MLKWLDRLMGTRLEGFWGFPWHGRPARPAPEVRSGCGKTLQGEPKREAGDVDIGPSESPGAAVWQGAVSERGEARPLLLHPVTLEFRGEQRHLEQSFRDHYFAHSLHQLRCMMLLGMALYALFGILDAILLPDHRYQTWLIRFVLVCPVAFLTYLSTFHPAFKRLMQPMVSMAAGVSGIGIILMIAIVPPPVNYFYYTGLILVFIYLYTMVRLRFAWATLTGWVLAILYEIAAIWLSETPVQVLINNNFFLISANLMGMIACYGIEYHARRDFYLVHLLGEEREKVRLANTELEARVELRTAQLSGINENLQVQIAERLRVEEERLRLEHQLKQAEKMEAIGNLAAGVAHDLNNLLGAMVGYPELLLLDLPEDSPLQGSLRAIQSSGQKAAAVVQDLLTLSRQGASVKEALNLNRLIEEYLHSAEFQRLRAAHPHVRLEIDLDRDLLDVLGSPIHLSKTLMNLVHNAFEANLVAGGVKISTANRYLDHPLEGFERINTGEYAVINVADTGLGIAAEDMKRIFEPFFTRKRFGRSGTGLGMAVVWWAVRDHGGYLDIRSIEGQGTSISVYLPLTRQPAAENARQLNIDDYRGSEAVLVVDDVEEQRELAARMLGKLGYQVARASSGEEAVQYLDQTSVDILVLDMIMDPGIDGAETYRRIIAKHPGQKAIIASGYAESEKVRETQRLGAGVYVRKPYTMAGLAVAIRKELDRRLGNPPTPPDNARPHPA